MRNPAGQFDCEDEFNVLALRHISKVHDTVAGMSSPKLGQPLYWRSLWLIACVCCQLFMAKGIRILTNPSTENPRRLVCNDYAKR